MKVNSKEENGELIIEIRFDNHDQLCLKNDLVDIVDWYTSGPAREKIANCRSRMIKDNKDRLMASEEMSSKTMSEVSAIMNDPIAAVEAICKMPDYKNRAQRESKEG